MKDFIITLLHVTIVTNVFIDWVKYISNAKNIVQYNLKSEQYNFVVYILNIKLYVEHNMYNPLFKRL
jgi:hypothetical protein